jgi:hypothetical protein
MLYGLHLQQQHDVDLPRPGSRLEHQQQYAFDVASFPLGLAAGKNWNMFDAGTYTEKRPEISAVTLRSRS